jgi:hypothetical protein
MPFGAVEVGVEGVELVPGQLAASVAMLQCFV